MYVNPGELKKRIEIVTDSGKKNENGFSVGEETVHKCAAKYTRQTGTEKEGAGADVNKANVRFLIRYTKKKLSHKMQVIYAGKRYNIHDINDIGDEHRYLELFCTLGEL